ncbi:HMP-PP phosphatase [Winslowiella iniecta]|uniref:HMP-PP phosphatase n=1 Tax=Winslowiella iniecta TaxID=1560201 RepID=A0A0L7T3M2_9GAMM|nr:HMP-PP phosphatase [Winslowiella iniecta]KOC89933.1 thiamin pyrimidine pyrophosphate hydrolase [Winslowiella iniecta]KOC94338.1 thiamin pyrimidine pyrophosphate hydrolase [Winslowiella iniecta]
MSRLAAFDMDGTLLLPNHQFGKETLAALRALQKKQVVLAFATGRHLLEMEILAAELALDAWLITSNGTRISGVNGERLFGCDLPAEIAHQLTHTRWDTTATLHLFNDDGWFTATELPEILQAHLLSGFSYQLTDVRHMPADKVTKICFIAEHGELLRLEIQLREALGCRAHLCFSAWECLEVLPLNCNKGTALNFLSNHLGLTMADCMAFGDAMNDREMLESVGRGFIMGNAMHQLKNALPHLPVIGHCATQGVSHYLNHWLTTPHLSYTPHS